MSTLLRHANPGILLANGQRIRLETVRIGGRTYTTDAAIATFIAAQNTDQPAAPAVSASQRKRQPADARRELASQGV